MLLILNGCTAVPLMLQTIGGIGIVVGFMSRFNSASASAPGNGALIALGLAAYVAVLSIPVLICIVLGVFGGLTLHRGGRTSIAYLGLAASVAGPVIGTVAACLGVSFLASPMYALLAVTAAAIVWWSRPIVASARTDRDPRHG